MTLPVTVCVTLATPQSGVGGRGEGQKKRGAGRGLRVLVMPLGEASQVTVGDTVRRHLAACDLAAYAGSTSDRAASARSASDHAAYEWFDRRTLRGGPLAIFAQLARLRRRPYDAAVLVAPDLRHPRLRLTSLLLALPRSQHKWRLDQRGTTELFSTRRHLANNVVPILRHLGACLLVLVSGHALLRAVEAWLVKPRPIEMKRPERLLYLRSQLWLGLAGGGSVAHTAGVIGGLQQAGVSVTVVSSDTLTGVSAPTHLVPPETWFDGKLRELEDLAYNVPFLLASWRTARRDRSQVLYQRHTAFNCAGAALSRALRLPLVLEFNSSELWKGRYWGGLFFRRVAALVERINLRAADRVVVVSDVLRSTLVADGVPPEKILVNPNAVDTDLFSPGVDGSATRRRLGLDAEDIVIGFSGTFGLWHGIPSLAAALPIVTRRRPNARWLLIGDGALRPVIDQAIEQHGLGARVIRPGLVPHGDMPSYLAGCDILVSPHGRQADGGTFFGSPTKLFEYMAMGRPIVASAVGQIADVLRHEQTALLVAPDDPSALSHAIVRLIDDARLRRSLAEQARAAAVAHHTWRQNAEHLLASLDTSSGNAGH